MNKIKELSNRNLKIIAELAIKLWPESSLEEEVNNLNKIINDDNKTAFLASNQDVNIGFVQVCLRYDYVEGTNTNPVCYIEGIYIAEKFRRQGYAESLIKEAEKWGKAMGCSEIASDTEILNLDSINFHNKVGFNEINRIVCFSKPIS